MESDVVDGGAAEFVRGEHCRGEWDGEACAGGRGAGGVLLQPVHVGLVSAAGAPAAGDGVQLVVRDGAGFVPVQREPDGEAEEGGGW